MVRDSGSLTCSPSLSFKGALPCAARSSLTAASRAARYTGGMFQVEIYGRVRRAVRVEGRSQRAVARELGLSRETVRKMLQFAVPPGYQRQQPIRRPKLGPWLGVIDAILEDDKLRPAKQRHTAKRIFERLKEEQGFTGGY